MKYSVILRNIILTGVLCGLTLLQVIAQESVIRGTVTDNESKPVVGATVLIAGTNNGTVTDINGQYSVKVNAATDKLIFSFIGYQKEEITVNSQKTIDVILIPENTVLNEIVVMAYSDKKKTEISSAVVALKADDINKVTTNSIEEMLVGKVAGVQVQNSSGQPGQSADIRIRGVGSVFSSQRPLVVVDGIIGGSYDPNDIESVTVLKDAGATGLYGSRAAAGVILITTKSGSRNKSMITAKITRGIKKPEFGKFMVMNSQELYSYHKSVYPSTLFSIIRPKELLKRDYDWIGNTYTESDMTTAYVSGSGGNEATNYFLSFDYMNDEGTLKSTNYKRISVRSKVKHAFSERLSMTTNVTGSYNYSRYPHWSLAQGAFRLMPWDLPYDENGDAVYDIKKAGWYSNVTNNPYHSLQYNKYDNYGLDFSGSLTINYTFTKWLKLETRSSASGSYGKYEEIESPLSYEGSAVDGRILNSINFGRSYGNTTLLKFEKAFGPHNISGLAGVEGGKYTIESGYGGVGNGILPGQEVLGVAGSIEKAVGTKAEVSTFSVLSQLNYDFQKKYFLTLSARRDGSSKFSPDSKYANFFTASASWLVTAENFMKSLPSVNYLKLRTSYGAVGNETFPNDNYYPYFPSYSGGYIYNDQTAYYPSNMGNYNLTWETSHPFNLGLDLGLFRKVEFNIDYYNTRTQDLLFQDPLPSSQGFEYQWKNVGEIQNKGIEFSVNGAVLSTNGFTWDLNFNISANHNELVKLSDKQGVNNIIVSAETFRQILEPGKPAFNWYMPKWLGVDPDNGNPLWEKLIYDSNGQVVSTEKTSSYNEATFQSVASPFPKFTGGFGTVLGYKGISLSAAFSFVSGNKIYNATRQQLDNDGANLNVNAYKLQPGMSRWAKPGDIATHPKPVIGGNNNAHEYSSRYLEVGSYLRIRNITLSYQVPSSITNKVKISSMKINLMVDNLKTWTKFTGMDPDVPLFTSSWLLPGVSSFKYPISRQFNAGIEISF
ncbi:MAG TPA: SusC/RagA family TonB-linked outer membrane protein [Bacteroidales bacterium]|nr:SusC/RagA family TonB-linked outer membrane protein [Bacteroidales bacterium]